MGDSSHEMILYFLRFFSFLFEIVRIKQGAIFENTPLRVICLNPIQPDV